jgi:hypothetical protein
MVGRNVTCLEAQHLTRISFTCVKNVASETKVKPADINAGLDFWYRGTGEKLN